MSISSEITRISDNVSDALDAIESKGVTIPAGANSDDLSSLISSIRTGSSVVVTPTLLTGTDIASISVDGDSTTLYSPTPPTPSSATPQALGTASPGSSTDYSRADHVHAKPSYSKSDVGLSNVDNVKQYSASNPPPYPVTSVNGSTGAVTVSVPSAATATPSDLGTAAVGTSTKWAKEDHVHKMPSASDVGALPDTTSIPSKTSDLTNDSGYITGMVELSYGISTWDDFIAAYNAKKIVYCRASSGTNPASGSQTRKAFMAYVDNADNPTNVEFQYYRSVSTHTDSQQGDQVYVYKLVKSTGWSVTVRESYSKIATGTGISKSYSNGTITLSSTVSVPTASDATPENLGTAAAGSSANYSRADHVHAMPTASDVGALPSSTVIPSKVSDLTNDSGFVNASGAAAAAPVQSVNGQTGAVTITDSDEKLKTEDLADSTEKYVLLGPASTTAETKYYTTGMSFKARSDEKTARLTIGISGNSSSTTRRSGQLALYNQDKYCILRNNSTTNSGYYVNLPASGGTLALTSEVPTKVSDLTNDSAFVNASGAAAAAPVQSVNGATGNVTISIPEASTTTPANLGTAAIGTSTKWAKADHVHKMPSASDVGLGNVDNVKQYSASNPPPYPVTSVNGSTGAVTVAVPSAATATPANLGTAAVGISTKYAKEDHVHNYPDVVHVGSSAPADTNIELWLDNSSGGNSVVTSVNGKTGTVEVSTIAVQDSTPTGGELVWIDTDEPGESITIPQIDDNNVSAADTWSSQKISSEISSSSSSGGAMYFPNQTVNVATNAEIFRITNTAITTQTVLVECTFASPASITSDVTWTTYDGYIAFNGTCTSATTADVTLSNVDTPSPQTPLAIANGGTGANNAADALKNLGGLKYYYTTHTGSIAASTGTDISCSFTDLGIPSDEKAVIANVRQYSLGSSDDTWHSLFFGWGIDNTNRRITARVYSTRTTVASPTIIIECLAQKI